jgi:hypothetical protein
MKRKTLAAVLGAAGVIGMAISSYGQGNVIFNNYGASPYYAVVYGTTAQHIPAGLAGTAAGANVNVELGWALGTVTSGFTLVPSSITAVNGTLTQPDDGVGSPIGGWFQGPTLALVGYSAGPISFEILATVASGPNAGLGWGGSLVWTEPSIPSGLSPAGYFTAMPGDVVIVAPVPEPTTLALAGLGGLALLAFRRKQA